MLTEENAKRRSWELEFCRGFLEHHCIYRSPPGGPSLVHRSGAVNEWQFFMPVALLDQEFVTAFGTLFWDVYGPKFDKQEFQLCGVESGGSLLVSQLQGAGRRRGHMASACMIKKRPKTYGLQNLFEGIIHESLPLVLVDDVVASGGTLETAKMHCTNAGLVVGEMVALCASKDLYKSRIPDVKLFYGADQFNRTWAEYHRTYGQEPAFRGSLI